MMEPAAADLDRFAEVIERNLGLRFADAGSRQLRDALTRRVAARKSTVADYLALAEHAPHDEMTAWASELTVSETYFLRHVEQFTALTDAVLPVLRQAGSDPAQIKLLCAGCATGEEAYSLALSLRQHNSASQPSILGIDLNPAALEHARRGRYSAWSLRAVPASVRARWFLSHGDEAAIDPALQKLVRFEQSNLKHVDPDIWPAHTYDVVFCRNVLMYLTREVMEQVVGRIATSLKPGGFLFLGSAETLRGMSTPFELRETHGAFYYQSVPAHTPATRAESTSVRQVAPMRQPKSLSAKHLATQASTSGVAGLGKMAGQAPSQAPDRAARLDTALDLLRRERFSEGLVEVEALLRQRDRSSQADADMLLLRAALLTHSGRLPDADHACQQLIATSVSPGAHLLLAMVRECEDDNDAAITHCRAAAGGDPSFAMPQVHLGRLVGKTSGLSSARRHFTRAIELLPAETELRMLLFGGGFEREALMSFCRTQLAQSQGAR